MKFREKVREGKDRAERNRGDWEVRMFGCEGDHYFFVDDCQEKINKKNVKDGIKFWVNSA